MLRIFTAAALLALTVTTTAQAGSWSDSMLVAYGDLNLSKSADAKVLADRLQTAATQVCLNANDDIRLSSRYGRATNSELQGCVDTAINIAMLRIEKNLTAHVRANLINSKQAALN
jgi:UrcA family protein